MRNLTLTTLGVVLCGLVNSVLASELGTELKHSPCPTEAQAGQSAVLLPDVSDRTAYWVCVNNHPFWTLCPDAEYFDAEKHVCSAAGISGKAEEPLSR
ncbi:carbohydrate-binding module family 14 protein [Paraburkholderia aspalathi]|uniref:carbohydrate-binding module family 14 protein n=1 Tax=Paraburkholderia aspalathi TaxID=1324617 RepID=UPI0038BAC366